MQAKSLLVRFNEKWLGEPNSGCWLWMGGMLTNGYGYYNLGPPEYRKITVHRLSWGLHFGDIPEEMMVCHKCDIRCCVNPSHLFLGTHQDNMDDMYKKNRHAYGTRVANSRLTDDDVRDILRTDAAVMNKDIAKKYGVARSLISLIRSGKRWAHIAKEI